ncbi:hypothetical protein WS70_18975 [Burkholderia mayonis]|uniref:ABC transporter domain-containing protein n=1 Tax=Burkholderia mayonis TaxID=1385591 RepID=A0A1B4FK29_9BURK|nr:hypothetical protein WS70_18975 [Burkholderia mayonis]KVE49224.1 hypothetical protein WS70_20355 [Burkholderia mayonis]
MVQLFDSPCFIERSTAARREAGAAARDAAAAFAAGAAVSFEHASKVFNGPHGPSAALRAVTLDVARGGVFGVIGRSGAGKSTLLRLINGLERPSSGAGVNGVDVGAPDATSSVARAGHRVRMAGVASAPEEAHRCTCGTIRNVRIVHGASTRYADGERHGCHCDGDADDMRRASARAWNMELTCGLVTMAVFGKQCHGRVATTARR